MRYKIYVDRNLLVDVLEGSIELSDLERIFQHEVADTNFKFVNKVLSNISNAQLNISANEIEKFVNFMSSPNKNNSFRWAILTNDPKQTALSILIKETEYFNRIVGVFSTLKACNQFLNISLDNKCFSEDDYIILD